MGWQGGWQAVRVTLTCFGLLGVLLAVSRGKLAQTPLLDLRNTNSNTNGLFVEDGGLSLIHI